MWSIQDPFCSRFRYGPLPKEEVEPTLDYLLSQDERQQRRRMLRFTIVNTAILVVTATWILLAEQMQYAPSHDLRYQNPMLNTDLKHLSAYSPLLDEVDLTPRLTVLNGLFHDNETIFMQEPSPAVDKAWDLFSQDIFFTSADAVEKTDRDPAEYITTPDGNHIVQWDVFHQIHCLNWLRKDLNHEYYYGDKNHGQLWKDHQKHCINMLLQVLTCHADVDIIPYQWMEKDSDEGMDDKARKESETRTGRKAVSPAPDFMVQKMCRNFNGLVEWANANKVPDPKALQRELRLVDGVKVWKWNDL